MSYLKIPVDNKWIKKDGSGGLEIKSET